MHNIIFQNTFSLDPEAEETPVEESIESESIANSDEARAEQGYGGKGKKGNKKKGGGYYYGNDHDDYEDEGYYYGKGKRDCILHTFGIRLPQWYKLQLFDNFFSR